MNVIVSNRQKEIIDNANIDAIKDLNGLFNVDDLINKFKNYFFSKMILDATSVVNFASREVLTTLVEEIGAEKLIILLPSNPEPPMEFKKLLIELKIYNFTNNIDDVVKFIETPNTYEDAIKTIDNSFGNNMYVDNSIKEGESDNSIPEENNNDSNSGAPHRSLGDMLSSFNVADFDKTIGENSEEESNEETTEEPKEEENQPNEDNSKEENNDSKEESESEEEKPSNEEEPKEEKESFDYNPKESSNKNTFLIYDNIDNNDYDTEVKKGKSVIGVVNVTLHAGSTSLIYMLHRMLTDTLKKSVLSIEVNKKDFKLYRDNKMISIDGNNLNQIVEDSKDDIILVDLNDYADTSVCTDVLYLVEPSTIKLNKLMVENKNAFNELKDKKVIINKSMLSDNDIRTLSSEAGVDFFDSIGPLNDRMFNDAIDKLINKLDIK